METVVAIYILPLFLGWRLVLMIFCMSTSHQLDVQIHFSNLRHLDGCRSRHTTGKRCASQCLRAGKQDGIPSQCLGIVAICFANVVEVDVAKTNPEKHTYLKRPRFCWWMSGVSLSENLFIGFTNSQNLEAKLPQASAFEKAASGKKQPPGWLQETFFMVWVMSFGDFSGGCSKKFYSTWSWQLRRVPARATSRRPTERERLETSSRSEGGDPEKIQEDEPSLWGIERSSRKTTSFQAKAKTGARRGRDGKVRDLHSTAGTVDRWSHTLPSRLPSTSSWDAWEHRGASKGLAFAQRLLPSNKFQLYLHAFLCIRCGEIWQGMTWYDNDYTSFTWVVSQFFELVQLDFGLLHTLGGAETVLDFWGQQCARFFATQQGRWTWRLIVHKEPAQAAATDSHLSWLPLALIPCCSRRQQVQLVFPRGKKKLLSLLQQRWVQGKRTYFGPTSVCSAGAPVGNNHFESKCLLMKGLKRETFECNSLFQTSRRVAVLTILTISAKCQPDKVGIQADSHGLRGTARAWSEFKCEVILAGGYLCSIHWTRRWSLKKSQVHTICGILEDLQLCDAKRALFQKGVLYEVSPKQRLGM